MECPNCESEYEGEVRIPRILPYCGHSLCQLCLKALWRQRQILCPQCGKSSAADSQDAFPVNHSLIQLKLKGSSDVSLCATHGKSLEAFCVSEKEALCVVCILGDVHKSHEVLSLSQAANSEREALASMSVRTLQLEQDIATAAARIRDGKAALHEELARTKDSLKKVFDLVREVVDEREATVLGKLESGLQTELRNFDLRLEELRRKEYLLEALKAEVSKTEDESDYELLLKSKDREVVAREALTPVKPVPQAKTLAESSREGELNTIWRQVKERFLLSGSQNSVKKPVPVSITSLDQARDAKKQGKALTTSAEESTFKRMKKPESGRRISPLNSISSGLKPAALKVTVHPAARKTSPVPKTPQARNSQEFKKKMQVVRLSSPPISSDFSSDMDETPIHTHTVDLSAFLRQPAAVLYALGGFSDGVTHVARYDCRADVWEDCKTQCGRTLCGCVLWGDDTVLLIGGKVNGKRVSSSELFHPALSDFRPGPLTLRAVRSGFACLLSQKSLYCIGGSDGTPLKTAEVWDGREWKDLPDMANRRDELAAVVGPDGDIYVFGGYGGADMTCQSACERFSPTTHTWTAIAGLNTPRRALSAVALPDSVLAIGGYDGAKYLNSVEQLSYATGQWTVAPGMNQSRCAFAAVASPDSTFVYVLGGFNGSALREVEKYDVREKAWREVSLLPQPRFMHCVAALPRR